MLDYDYFDLLYIPIVMTVFLTVTRNLKPLFWYLIIFVFLVAQVLLGLTLRGYSERFWLNTVLFSLLPFGLVALILRTHFVRTRPVLMPLLGVSIFWLGILLGIWISLGLGYGP